MPLPSFHVLYVLSTTAEANAESIRNQSCHAFVMVKAGKKELKETIYLEPATGRPYNSQNVPLNGIVALWNHQNYWVNMQVSVCVYM